MGMWVKKTKIMSLRMDPKLWKRMEEVAVNAGHRTPSEWVRNLINLNLPSLFEQPGTPEPKKIRRVIQRAGKPARSRGGRPPKAIGRRYGPKKPAK